MRSEIGDVFTAVPGVFQFSALVGETFGELLHERGDEFVGALDGLARLVDECGLRSETFSPRSQACSSFPRSLAKPSASFFMSEATSSSARLTASRGSSTNAV